MLEDTNSLDAPHLMITVIFMHYAVFIIGKEEFNFYFVHSVSFLTYLLANFCQLRNI